MRVLARPCASVGHFHRFQRSGYGSHITRRAFATIAAQVLRTATICARQPLSWHRSKAIQALCKIRKCQELHQLTRNQQRSGLPDLQLHGLQLDLLKRHRQVRSLESQVSTSRIQTSLAAPSRTGRCQEMHPQDEVSIEASAREAQDEVAIEASAFPSPRASEPPDGL